MKEIESRSRTESVLPLVVILSVLETKIDHTNLEAMTLSLVEGYRRLSPSLICSLGFDMETVWQSFATQFENLGLPDFDLDPALFELAVGRGTGEYKYGLLAGSKSVEVSSGIKVQDVLVCGKSMVAEMEEEKVTIEPTSPFLVFSADSLKPWERGSIKRLIESFVQTLGSLHKGIRFEANDHNEVSDGLHARLGGVGFLKLLEQVKRYSPERKVDLDFLFGDKGGRFVYDEFGGANQKRVDVHVDSERVSDTFQPDIRWGWVTTLDHLTYGELVKKFYDVAESRLLFGLAQVQKQASEAREVAKSLFLDSDPKKQVALDEFLKLMYGTWVGALLMLWQEKFRKPTEEYLLMK